jgi:hypothetical protein
MGELERIVEITPAFDGRPQAMGGRADWRRPTMKTDDGTAHTNYGVGGCDVRMVLKGPLGAVQFVVYTDWLPPHVQEERMVGHRQSVIGLQPMGVDVGYHSPTPQCEGQTNLGPCEYLDGRECYYDGSGLRADEWVRTILLREGSDGIWRALECEYKSLFVDGNAET